MLDFWSYSFADFVLFTPRVFYRLLEMRNVELWPVHAATLLLGLAMVVLAVRPTPMRLRIILSLCGVMWLWLAWSYFWRDYASINWVAAYFAPVAALQGALLVLVGGLAKYDGEGVDGGVTATSQRQDAPRVIALGLMGFAVVGYPFIAVAIGRSWWAAEVFGATPDPTATATLAAVALVPGQVRWWLVIIPAAWCVLSGLTLHALGANEFLVAPLCAAVLVARMTLRARG